MKKLLLTSIAAVTLTSGVVSCTTVSADSNQEYKVRYVDTENQGGGYNGYNGGFLQVFSYTDRNGKSKILYKDPEYIKEYITDTNKATISNIGAGGVMEFVRPPYQTYPVDVYSLKVTTIGWTEFIKQHSDVKGKDVKLKWIETVANPDGSSDHPQYQIIEFAYKNKLYRMYLTPGSNGEYNFKEDISVSYSTNPTIHFSKKDGSMTLQRQPNTNYVQPTISGTVTDK